MNLQLNKNTTMIYFFNRNLHISSRGCRDRPLFVGTDPSREILPVIRSACRKAFSAAKSHTLSVHSSAKEAVLMHNQGDLRRIRLFPSGKDIADPVELTANAPDIDIPMPSASEKIHSPIAVAAQDVRRRRTETGATPEQSVFQKKNASRHIRYK